MSPLTNIGTPKPVLLIILCHHDDMHQQLLFNESTHLFGPVLSWLCQPIRSALLLTHFTDEANLEDVQTHSKVNQLEMNLENLSFSSISLSGSHLLCLLYPIKKNECLDLKKCRGTLPGARSAFVRSQKSRISLGISAHR